MKPIYPFAMLVPFLIMSVSVSHGVQYVSSWADEVANRGASNQQAALVTFRSLAIPGVVALISFAGTSNGLRKRCGLVLSK